MFVVKDGKAYVDDLTAVALPVLRHRVLLRLESELDRGKLAAMTSDIGLAETIEAARNIVATGARPIAISDCTT